MIIRAKAPLRISFAGGGMDVPPFRAQQGGLVLNATINRYAYGTLRSREDDNIQILSHDYGLTTEFGVHEPLVFDGSVLVAGHDEPMPPVDHVAGDLADAARWLADQDCS